MRLKTLPSILFLVTVSTVFSVVKLSSLAPPNTDPRPSPPPDLQPPPIQTPHTTDGPKPAHVAFPAAASGLLPSKCAAVVATKEPPHKRECMPAKEVDPRAKRVPLTLVTAASEGFTGHLTNFLGSVHLWEPNLEVAVYDIGLGDDWRRKIQGFCGVHLFKLDFGKYPQHFHNLRNFAWKTAIIEDAARRFGKILYLDAGRELRRPIDFIKNRIDSDGYFCAGMGESLTWGNRHAVAHFYNDTLETWFGRPAVDGGLQGVCYWRPEYEIVRKTFACGMKKECIEAAPDPGESYRFGDDQTIWSMWAYSHSAAQCGMDRAFTRHIDGGMPVPETTISRQILFVRRAQSPKPFDKYLLKTTDSKCQHRNGVKNDKAWAELLASDPVAFAGDKPCRCLHSARPVGAYSGTTTVVTAANSAWFRELQNLVGSVHHHEPEMAIVVYDLGLSPENLETLRTWRNVEVRAFVPACEEVEARMPGGNAELCRQHADVASSSDAWRPFVLAHAATTIGEYLFLTAGHELRNSLEPLVVQLRRDGIFTVCVIHDLTQWSTSAYFSAVGISQQWLEFRPLCSPAVFGFSCDDRILRGVLAPMLACARRKECWGNARGPESPYSAADVVMSTMIYNNTCYTCNRDTPYYEYRGSMQDPVINAPTPMRQHLQRGYRVLFNRHQGSPKPYIDMVRTKGAV
eukprot:m51a1_g635 hypothetical protein (686) ;mRNA; r:155996-158431